MNSKRESKRESKRKKKGVFDVPLAFSILANKSSNTKLPDVVDQVINYLERNGKYEFIK